MLAYRGKLLAGGILTAFFIALQIMSNHVQMSYYFLFVILFIAGAYFEDAWRNKTLPRFFKASAVLLVAALIGVAANLSNLYHTYTYSKETMRGKSELVQTGDAAKQTSSGLDRDYITNWSYGIGETWTLLVPNFKGGSSSAPSARAKPPWKRPIRCTEACTIHSRSTSAASPGRQAPFMWAHSYCSSSCWAALS